MKSGITAAWLAAMLIVGWRDVHSGHRIPAPGQLLGISALFVAGALVSEWVPRAEPLILATLVGLDAAAFLDVLPRGLGAQISQAQAAEATGTTQAPGTSTAGGRG